MFTTNFAKSEVVRNTALRLKTFTKQYESLVKTPNTEKEWLNSLAITIYELAMVEIKNRKIGREYLSNVKVSELQKEKIKDDIKNNIISVFKTYSDNDFENYIIQYSKSIALRIINK